MLIPTHYPNGKFVTASAVSHVYTYGAMPECITLVITAYPVGSLRLHVPNAGKDETD